MWSHSKTSLGAAFCSVKCFTVQTSPREESCKKKKKRKELLKCYSARFSTKINLKWSVSIFCPSTEHSLNTDIGERLWFLQCILAFKLPPPKQNQKTQQQNKTKPKPF